MSLQQNYDQGLVEAAILGDAKAIASLLSHSQKDLTRFARRLCNSAEDAEDAVQAALWQVYRKVGALRSAQAFATWLFRIVERECRRLFRMSRETSTLDDASIDELPAAAVPVDLRYDLALCIQSLPEIYRRVLIMRDVEEISAAEVASISNISVEAVKSRLHRARSMLREKLGSSGYWSDP